MDAIIKVENLKKYFDMTVEYFNNVLHIPLKIYLADEEAVEFLHLKESDDFVVTEQEDLKDYLYDGEAMRKLSGKKLHKKKNHLNAFLKEYVLTGMMSGVSWTAGEKARAMR